MPGLNWQKYEVPFIQGIDAKSAPMASPNPQLSTLQNAVFSESGVVRKRNGYAALGAGLTKAAALALFNDELLVQDNFALKTWIAGRSSWVSRGALRSIGLGSGMVAEAATALSSPTCASGSGYVAYGWVDAAGVPHVQVAEDATGAVVSVDGLMTPFGAVQRIQCVATGGYIFTIYADATGAILCSRFNPTTGTQDSSAVLCSDAHAMGAFRVAGSGSLLALFYVKSTNAYVVRGVSMALVPDAGTQLAVGATTAQKSAALAVAFAGNGDAYFAWNTDGTTIGAIATNLAWTTLYAAKTIATGSYLPNVAISVVSGGAAPVVRLIWTNGTSSAPNVSTRTLDHSGATSAIAGIMNGVRLASDSFVQDSDHHAWVECFSAVTSKVTNTDVTVTAANSVFLLINTAGTIVARARQGRAALVADGNLPALATVATGVYLAAVPILSDADSGAASSTTIIAPAAVGYLRADFAGERMRSAQVDRDLLLTGAAPSSYDGTNVVEHGFSVFPEVTSVAQSMDYVQQIATRQASTAYVVGALVVPATLNGYAYVCTTAGTTGSGTPTWTTGIASTTTDGGVTWTRCAATIGPNAWTASHAYVVGDHIKAVTGAVGKDFVCTVAGNSNGSEPVWNTTVGGFTTDSGVTWQCTGNINPEGTLAGYAGLATWAPGTTYQVGVLFKPTTANGFYYVAAQAFTSTATEPSWPTTIGAVTSATDPAGGMPIYCAGVLGPQKGGGSWTYYSVYEHIDAKGLLHQSYPSSAVTVAFVGGSNNAAVVTVSTLRATRKVGARIGIYRNQNNGTAPQKVAQLANDTTVATLTWTDTIGDGAQASGVLLYTAASEIPNEPAPALSSMAIRGQRVYGVGGEDPYAVYASKVFGGGYGLGFSSALKIPVDTTGGKLMAVATMDDKTVLFQAGRILILTGDGPDNTGAGTWWAEPQQVPTDVGCTSPDSIVLTPGGLMFQSSDGRIYLLGREGQVSYIGAPADGVPGTITAADLVPNATQVRFLCATGAAVVYDYFAHQWSTFTNHAGLDAASWGGRYVYVDTANRVCKETPGIYLDADGSTPLVTTAGVPVKFDGMQGFVCVRSVAVLGESRGDATFAVGVSYDGSSVVTTEGNLAFTAAGALVGGGMGAGQVLIRKPKCSAVAITLTEQAGVSGSAGLALLGLAFEVGIKGGVRRFPASQRVG